MNSKQRRSAERAPCLKSRLELAATKQKVEEMRAVNDFQIRENNGIRVSLGNTRIWLAASVIVNLSAVTFFMAIMGVFE